MQFCAFSLLIPLLCTLITALDFSFPPTNLTDSPLPLELVTPQCFARGPYRTYFGCRDAYTAFVRKHPYTNYYYFSHRYEPFFIRNIRLPQYSPAGSCTFKLDLAPGIDQTTEFMRNIENAAREVWKYCVMNEPYSQGGGLRLGNLILKMYPSTGEGEGNSGQIAGGSGQATTLQTATLSGMKSSQRTAIIDVAVE